MGATIEALLSALAGKSIGGAGRTSVDTVFPAGISNEADAPDGGS
jgi:hypothetical protein